MISPIPHTEQYFCHKINEKYFLPFLKKVSAESKTISRCTIFVFSIYLFDVRFIFVRLVVNM